MNPSINAEDANNLIRGATPVQIILILFLGIIALGVIISVVRWIIDMKLGTLPEDIKDIKATISASAVKMAQIESKLWTRDDINSAINSAINQHSASCPVRRLSSRNSITNKMEN